jgi:hypothetical protein
MIYFKRIGEIRIKSYRILDEKTEKTSLKWGERWEYKFGLNVKAKVYVRGLAPSRVSGQGPMVCCCEHGDGRSGFLRDMVCTENTRISSCM